VVRWYRTARLIVGAKKEGTLTLYSSAPVEVMTDVTNTFTKKYGVKVTLWRGGSEEIMQRVIAESRGGNVSADVVETAGPNIEAVNRENEVWIHVCGLAQLLDRLIVLTVKRKNPTNPRIYRQ